MNLSKVARWMLRQALGTKRGEMVIAMLLGPVGVILDLALQGRATEALMRLDTALDGIREVIS